MRMRRAKRTSSAEIRTTGIVQLDSPRPRKRTRRSDDNWSPESSENGTADSPEAVEQPVAKDVEDGNQVEAERGHGKPDGVASAKASSDGDNNITSSDPTQEAAEKSQEKKSLRHFSRTKRASRSSRKDKEVVNKDHEPPSDVSADGVDLHRLPDDMKYAEDETVNKTDEEDRGAKQDCSISGRSFLDRVEECLNFLEELGLFRETGWVDISKEKPVDPGYVGDGTQSYNCKICSRPEDVSGTLVCDICEETFHMTCCHPKIRSPPRDDRWFCSTCTRKRKRKTAELKLYSSMHFDEKYPSHWKIDRTKTRGWDLLRMERTQVRVDPKKYQAEVPEWTGKICCEKLRADYPGLELPRSYQDKVNEKLVADAEVLLHRLGMAKFRSEGERENWLQCQNVLYEEGDMLPDGSYAAKDIVCGKWRRAPLHITADEGWECSCAVVWDPRHADCVVPQEVPTEEIRKRPRVRMQPSLDKTTRSCRDDKYLNYG